MPRDASHRKLVLTLVGVVVGMSGFGYALVPLYNSFCKAFGLNGRFVSIQEGTYTGPPANVGPGPKPGPMGQSRLVTVEFLGTVNGNLDWEFHPMVNRIKVQPGQVYTVNYYARNRTGRTVVAQAVPSLAPGLAVKYFTKMECFCFTQQTFEPHQGREMPLRFFVDPRLPKNVSTLTLNYTFFDTQDLARNNQGRSAQADIRAD